ncbi:MAG: class I SAM-dependent methyltransferase, partial [Bacteroidales bacterium]|nr:class I SAM-dependent methyltransferase [Bacteroidales bacterium]
MNDLEKYFTENTGRLIHKWMHYFEVYDHHFSRFRGTDVHILEFGIFQGGSLQMWKDYFGPDCRIYGIDINPMCKNLEEDRVEIFIGDQEDRTFLKSLAAKIPRIDILIDDGGHTMKQQIATV